MGRREDILKEIAVREARLAELRSDIEEESGRLSKLREELQTLIPDPFNTQCSAAFTGPAGIPRSNS